LIIKTPKLLLYPVEPEPKENQNEEKEDEKRGVVIIDIL